MKSTWTAACVWLLCGAPVAGLAVEAGPKKPDSETAALAAQVLKAYGLRRGIVVDGGSSSPALALELAKTSELRIYRVQDDPKAVERERAAVEAAGLSALRVRIEAGPLENLEYPSYAANIALCAGLPEPARLKEWGRIIRPQGFLILSPAPEAKGKLAPAEVQLHLEKHAAGCWQEPSVCGEAVCVRRAKLDGAAEWTHYARDPGNNRYSPDRLIKAPLRPLWFGPPLHPVGDLFFTQGLSAGGRLYLTDASKADTTRAHLTCLDAYNGACLWDREVGGSRYTKVEGTKADTTIRAFQLPGCVQPGEMAVSAERIFITDSKECLVLDAATGKDLARFKAPAPAHPENCWRYVAYVGDTLFGYADAPVPIPTPGAKGPAPGTQGGPPVLFALDWSSGASRWVRGGVESDELGAHFGTPLALGEERILVRANANDLHALDLRTGKTVWKATGLDEAGKESWWEGVIHRGKFMLHKFNMRTWGEKKKLAVLTFALADGAKVSELTEDLEKKEVFFNSQEGLLGPPPKPRLGCNYGSAAGPFYFHRNGYFQEKPGTPINSPGNAISYGGFRAACGIGALPVNGLVHLLPNGLECQCAPFHATVAYEPGAGIEKPAATFRPAPEELSALPEGQQQPASEADWPAYLANPARSGISQQDLSAPRKLAWEVKVAGEPTPCIAVKDQVFLGSTDECVYALNAATGSVRWKFHTSGPVRAAPAYANGRVFAGSDDGWLYALSAEDGKLLWRLRGGSSGRKQIAFETVVSPWPLTQGIAVDQERVYFTAGLISGQEIHVYAVDAKTGQVLWRTPVGSSCLVPCGYILLTPERVVLASPGSASIYHPIHLSRKDGTKLSAPVTHDDFTELRYVEGVESDEVGYRKGMVMHGGHEAHPRGYRAGSGYCSAIIKYDTPYHLSLGALDPANPKIPDHPWFGDGHSFLPLFLKDLVYYRRKGAVVAVGRADLYKCLDTREAKGNEREPFFKWLAKDFPCGEVQWLLAASGSKEGESMTLLAGGPKGVTALGAIDGKVLWSVPWDGPTTAGAIARGRIFATSTDGRVRALSGQ